MKISALFTRRVRGVRVVNLWGSGLLLILVIGLYLLKSFGSGERADIAHAQDQIAQEQTRIRLLNAEVAYLEQPARLERLSEDYLQLQPMSGRHETSVDELQAVAQSGAKTELVASPAAQPAGGAR